MLGFTRFSVILSLATLLAASQALAQQTAAPPAPVETLELSEGDCVVFLGDSITHQCLYTQYVEDFFYTRFPGKRIQFHNAGVGGAQAWDALQRFEKDVAAYEPEYVTVLLGMNDGRYVPFNQEIFDTYEEDMTALIEKIAAAGATPILMTPTMFDARAARAKNGGDEARAEYYNSVMAYFGTWLRDVAYRNGYGMVDMWSPLNNLTLEVRQEDPAFTMIPDAVHPGPDGQLVMAYAILDDMNLAKPLSNIDIDAHRDELKSKAKGGELSDLKRTDNGIRFTWMAEGLPFVVPEEAQQGAKLLHLGHRASREALTVSGLPAGRYELLIDGKSVGKFGASRLADGIELQNSEKTPQYQQAMKVATLNKQRNDGPVHALRGQWSIFQRYARAKRQVAEQPDNAEAAESLKKLEEQIAGMDERVQKAEAEAKAIEDEIFEVNQPKPHEYELRRVGGKRNKDPGKFAGSLDGTITLNGKPIENAKVVFQGKSKVLEAITDEAGSYSVAKKIPLGIYHVGITGENVRQRYAAPETSGLTVEIAEGDNVIDFKLTTGD